MDDIERQYSKLEIELTELSANFDEQKRMLNRSLKMLMGTLESDNPQSVQTISRQKIETLSQAQSLVRELEQCYRGFTMEREKIAARLYHAVSNWIAQKQRTIPEADKSSLDTLAKESEIYCESYTGLAKLLPALLELDSIQPITTPDSTALDARSVDRSTAQLARMPVEVLISIKRMLDLIPLEDSERKRAAEIVEGFNEAMASGALVESLKDIVSILEQRQARDVDEVANFLKSLAEQLAALQHELRESRAEDEAFENHEDSHSEQMSQGFDDIKSGLDTAKSFDELKSVVARQLDKLVVSFAEFKQRREERAELMQTRYDNLVARLNVVETDANSAHSTIDQERKKALTDHLTAIPNRRAYEERLRAELYRLERYHTPFSVLVVDIDFFKKVNDSLGHLVGDRALKLVAQVLGRLIRESDFIARYGGEEFVIVLAGTELDAAARTAEKLRHAIERAPFKYSGNLVDIRVSVGVTQAMPKDTAARLFERADKALYKAKQAGRNRVELN